MIDTSISLGNILEIGSIIIGGLGAIFTLRNTVTNLKNDMVDMKAELKKVGEVLIKLAVTDTRLTNLENDIRELKHGEGFIFPLGSVRPAKDG